MISSKFFVVTIVCFLVVVVFGGLVSENDMCGSARPDPTKTCISIRLPWNPQPIYFCVDKASFKYRNQCHDRVASYCSADIHQETLMVASPWDCCPLVSNPDTCANQRCPPAPHNRTCKAIEPNPNQPWECCGSYFCEDNITPDSCHFKRLEPTCSRPPPGKENCVAFMDNHGCCPKFQCAGEGRRGQCPAEVQAMKFMARFNNTQNDTDDEETTTAKPEIAPDGVAAGPGGAEGGGAAGRGMAKLMVSDSMYWPGPIIHNEIACVGDFNCPGKMKCCSHDMHVYITDSRYAMRNKNPTYGYCMEAITNATKPGKPKKKGM